MAGNKTGGLPGIVQKIRMYLKLFTHPDTPWYAKAILLGSVFYIFLPFDLIPDWILGFGIVDDLTIGSLLVWLALKLIDHSSGEGEGKG